jgi:methyl-accepting chemotaxis protein
MLTQKGFLPRSPGDFIGQVRNRFFQPISPLASETSLRSRLFNILVLSELFLFLLALPATFLLDDATRTFSATILFFGGAALTFAIAKSGRYRLAAWVNLGGVLLGLLYYNLDRPSDSIYLVYLDFRASCILLVFPVLIAGIVVPARESLAILVVALVALVALGVQSVPYDPTLGAGQFSFYGRLFRLPFAIIFVVGLSALVFERKVLKLCVRLSRRHFHLKEMAAGLDTEVHTSEKLVDEIRDTLVSLKGIFEEYQALLGYQETATQAIREGQSQLRQSNQQVKMMLGQAHEVINDSLAIVVQRGEAIRTNSAVYNRLQQLLELISHSVEELSLAAVQIEQVVGSISEIAEETNLLALNASIEAAGHLEQGRRFTMVASEVYRLAVRSREAAEEVRQVASEVQGGVVSLAKASSQGRDYAQKLAHTARSAPASVEQLTGLMSGLVRNSSNVFESLQELQNNLGGLLAAMTQSIATNEPSPAPVQALIESNQGLLENLTGMSGVSVAAPSPAPVSAKDLPVASSGKAVRPFQFFQKFYRTWLNSSAGGPRPIAARRRQARLLDTLSGSYCVFLAAYFVVSIVTRFDIINILPSAFFLVLLLLVYSFNKIGATHYALLAFFGSNFLFYTVAVVSQPTQFDTLDFIRTGGALFCISIVVAVILTNLRWVVWLTLLGMAWTAALAFICISQPFAGILELLIYPWSIQAAVGLLAGIISLNVTHLSNRIEEQNRRIAVTYRKAQLKKRRVVALSRQLTAGLQETRQIFEREARLAGFYFEALTELTEQVEAHARETARQGGSIRQIGQTVTNALEQVKALVRDADEGQRILLDFQGGVGEIASNSEALKIHAGEIGQIFELITAVADEIDLLALNATLEAAQARESGKRFGAVAGEIQRLAGRARQTGARVQSVISNVQEAVSLCALLTGRGLSELFILAESASEMTFSARTVIEVVGAGQKMVNLLEVSAQQQSDLLEQLNRHLREFRYTTVRFRPKIQSGFDYLSRLDELAQSLGRAGQPSASGESAELSPVEELV